MAASATKLIQIVQEGQARMQESQDRMLEYLRRADERGERQSRATLKALASIQDGQKAIQDGQRTIAQMLLEVQAITARCLEMTRDIHERIVTGQGTSH